MSETIDLGNGCTAEVRTDLTGGDQRWFLMERDRLILSNGTGKPARQELDPDNPAVMLDIPATPAYLRVEDNLTMIDMVAARLIVSSTMPGLLPWKPPVTTKDGTVTEPGSRDVTDLDIVNVLDNALGGPMDRLRGVVPKRPTTGPTSAPTSTESAPAPPLAPMPSPSSTPPAS